MPVNIKHVYFAGPNNVGNLFHLAGQVGKEVGTLVTVMTNEDGAAIVEDGKGKPI